MTTPRTPRRRRVAGALVSGGAASLLLLAPSIADAAAPLGEVLGRTTPPTTEPASEAQATGDDDDTVQLGDGLRDLLQSLVDDGTLTAEQLDAIVDAVRSAAPDVLVGGGAVLVPPIMRDTDRGPFGPGRGPRIEREVGPGRHGGLFGDAYAIDLIANTIGITAPDLLDQLADEATVAEIAETAGVDPQTVIDVLVADAETRIDAAVQSGRITEAVADERLESVTERITTFVTGETDADDDADAAATTEATTETTTG